MKKCPMKGGGGGGGALLRLFGGLLPASSSDSHPVLENTSLRRPHGCF